jgi:hypothetical protein
MALTGSKQAMPDEKNIPNSSPTEPHPPFFHKGINNKVT